MVGYFVRQDLDLAVTYLGRKLILIVLFRNPTNILIYVNTTSFTLLHY
jgi:hypothetical protein